MFNTDAADDASKVVIEQLKEQIMLLRIELKDALEMAYGARMNWPKSALSALGESHDG